MAASMKTNLVKVTGGYLANEVAEKLAYRASELARRFDFLLDHLP